LRFVTLDLVFWTVLVGGFAVVALAESVWPKTTVSSATRRSHFFHNLALWVVMVVVLSLTVGPATQVVTALSQFHRIGVLPAIGAPLWLAAVLGFLAADFSDYVLHRASHQNRTLWLMHAVHHADRHLDVTTSLRQHPLSYVFVLTVRAALILALGAPLWALVVRDICGVAMSHVHHASIAWSPRAIAWMERYLAWLVVPPTAHWVHHHPDPQYTNTNFGQVLSCWDRLFGTYRSGLNPPQESGLAALTDARWHTLGGMLLTPWRARGIAQL
jgi:sterol desaturase/sphingolipid hydroxylase (fatty acid hydroxylase superfamily)